MKKGHIHKYLVIGLLLGISLACNLPNMAAPTPMLFPTVDYTLTAIFGTIYPQTTPTRPAIVFITPTDTVPIPSNTAILLPTDTPTLAPTATTKPTKTPKAPGSYAGPDRRGVYPVVAYYVDTIPTIDGSFDEWDQEKYSMEYVVYGGDEWDGLSDCSGNFMVSWSKEALFIAARIRDDVYRQGSSGRYLFKGDSLEVLLDAKVSADFYLAELSGDDYQLGLSPGNPQPGENVEGYLWFPKSLEGTVSSVKIAAVETADGYRVEMKIPWNIFNIKPASGDVYGFALSISDNDRSGRNEQQTMVSNVKTRKLLNPMTWGDLILKK